MDGTGEVRGVCIVPGGYLLGVLSCPLHGGGQVVFGLGGGWVPMVIDMGILDAHLQVWGLCSSYNNYCGISLLPPLGCWFSKCLEEQFM